MPRVNLTDTSRQLAHSYVVAVSRLTDRGSQLVDLIQVALPRRSDPDDPMDPAVSEALRTLADVTAPYFARGGDYGFAWAYYDHQGRPRPFDRWEHKVVDRSLQELEDAGLWPNE